MTNSKHLIPLTEHAELSLIMPVYDLTPSLALDTCRLNRLAALGCFSEINFTAETEELLTYDHSMPCGIEDDKTFDEDAATCKTWISRSDFDPTDQHFFRDCHTVPQLSIAINSTMVHTLATQNRFKDVGEYWQRSLNYAIGGAVNRAAWRHLLGSNKLGEIATLGIATASVELFGRLMDFTAPYYGVPTAIGLANAAGALARHEIPRKKRCYSFIPGHHVDRALAVSVLAAFKPVIRTLK